MIRYLRLQSLTMWRVLWGFWKWLLHLLTGRCELHRIALSSGPVHEKTTRLRRSLANSETLQLREVVMTGRMAVSQAIQNIISVKKISPTDQPEFTDKVRPCVIKIRGVAELTADLEELRKEFYSSENQEHEKQLLKLWSLLCPGVSLEGRKTKQWGDIGFQGNDPATDFRGMGMLGLNCLLYFSEVHGELARRTLSHSHHPVHGYPLAIVCISLSSMALGWLRRGELDKYLYKLEKPLEKKLFMEMTSYLYVGFDQYWMDSKPENVMMYPIIQEQYNNKIREQLLNNSIQLTLSD